MKAVPTALVKWFEEKMFRSDLDSFGGYPGPILWFDDVVVVGDPGLESPKYAQVRFFGRREIEASYSWERLHGESDDDPTLFIELPLDSIAIGIKQGLEAT